MIRKCKYCGKLFISFMNRSSICEKCHNSSTKEYLEKMMKVIATNGRYGVLGSSDLRKNEIVLLERRIDEILKGYANELY